MARVVGPQESLPPQEYTLPGCRSLRGCAPGRRRYQNPCRLQRRRIRRPSRCAASRRRRSPRPSSSPSTPSKSTSHTSSRRWESEVVGNSSSASSSITSIRRSSIEGHRRATQRSSQVASKRPGLSSNFARRPRDKLTIGDYDRIHRIL